MGRISTSVRPCLQMAIQFIAVSVLLSCVIGAGKKLALLRILMALLTALLSQLLRLSSATAVTPRMGRGLVMRNTLVLRLTVRRILAATSCLIKIFTPEDALSTRKQVAQRKRIPVAVTAWNLSAIGTGRMQVLRTR